MTPDHTTYWETDNEWGSTHYFVEYELPLERRRRSQWFDRSAVWLPDAIEDGVKFQ